MNAVIDLFANVSALDFVIFIILVVGSVFYLTSRVRRESHKEVLTLAETRAEVIADLRAEIAVLRREVAELRGALETISDLKTDEIADATADRIIPFLDRRIQRLDSQE